MKLGFDAKRLFCNYTGLGNYSRTLVKNLSQQYSNNEYNLYTSKIKNTEESTFFLNKNRFQTHLSKSILKFYWRSFSVSKELQKNSVDLYHGLSNEIPFNLKKHQVKGIVTIHDLIFKVYPNTYSLIDRIIYDWKFKTSCIKADRIIAISESTNKDLVIHYGIQSDKIDVIYQCCAPLFYEENNNVDSSVIFEKYKIPTDYLLFVGSVEKRKNLQLIIKSYQHIPKDVQIPLVIVGGNRGEKENILKLIASYQLVNKIIWISDLNDNYQLQKLYQKATAVIYPSLYEGFGLPVIEALLSKTPVITSNVSSLPEAAGPDSICVNPTDPKELGEAITKVISNEELRAAMIENGYKYAIDNFSASVVTKQLVSCYEDVLNK